jgi:hypothetical protein
MAPEGTLTRAARFCSVHWLIGRLCNRDRGLGTNRCGNMEPEGILGGKFGSCLIGYKELEKADWDGEGRREVTQICRDVLQIGHYAIWVCCVLGVTGSEIALVLCRCRLASECGVRVCVSRG